MTHFRTSAIVALMFAALLSCGCAEGPLWKSGYLSPRVRQKWDDEERIAVTLFGRRQQLRETVDEALATGPARQEDVARHLGEIVAKDPVLLLRLEAVELLAELPVESATRTLSLAAGDQETSVRQAAVKSLGRRSDEASVTRLADVSMHDRDLDVRISATSQLGNTSSRAALPALANALVHADPAMQVCAARSLGKITGQQFGDDIEAWREHVREALPQETPAKVADQSNEGNVNR